MTPERALNQIQQQIISRLLILRHFDLNYWVQYHLKCLRCHSGDLLPYSAKDNKPDVRCLSIVIQTRDSYHWIRLTCITAKIFKCMILKLITFPTGSQTKTLLGRKSLWGSRTKIPERSRLTLFDLKPRYRWRSSMFHPNTQWKKSVYMEILRFPETHARPLVGDITVGAIYITMVLKSKKRWADHLVFNVYVFTYCRNGKTNAHFVERQPQTV